MVHLGAGERLAQETDKSTNSIRIDAALGGDAGRGGLFRGVRPGWAASEWARVERARRTLRVSF